MFAIFAFVLGIQAQAQTLTQDRDQFLKEFDQNPAKASAMLPKKYDLKGRRLETVSAPFSNPTISKKDFVSAKDTRRSAACKGVKPGESCRKKHSLTFATMDSRNDVEMFAESSQVERNLARLNQLGLQQGKTEVQPWSGDYWATAYGGIAIRYNDDRFPMGSFGDIWNFMATKTGSNWSFADDLNVLSPAEKYDLLLSDSDKTLTQNILDASNEVWKRDGSIEGWWGICHGWAPASFMVKRPRHAVEIQMPATQKTLKFYPDDIKALASHLWAHSSYSQAFIGGRCNDKNPAVDENGRVISPDCFDVNPATWHLGIVHQVGQNKRSFVMDATYDYEVWNQPVASYSYTYFNPQTRQGVYTLEEATVPMSQFSNDVYRKYRSSKAASVVGIAMNVTYIREIQHSASETDDEYRDAQFTVQYFYDLELDANGDAIGGEWYQQAHPDFMWKPTMNANVASYQDASLEGKWTNSLPPAQWTVQAKEASKNSLPLSTVINQLVEKAQ